MAMFKIVHPWGKYTCKQCNQENNPKIIEKGTHTEAICPFCEKHWKFLSKEDKYGTKEQRIKIYNKTLGRCGYCGCNINPNEDNSFHHDHINPQSNNGSNLEENLLFSCKTCNTQKGKKNITDYRAFLKQKSNKLTWIFFYEILNYSFYGQKLSTEYNDSKKLNNTAENERTR